MITVHYKSSANHYTLYCTYFCTVVGRSVGLHENTGNLSLFACAEIRQSYLEEVSVTITQPQNYNRYVFSIFLCLTFDAYYSFAIPSARQCIGWHLFRWLQELLALVLSQCYWRMWMLSPLLVELLVWNSIWMSLPLVSLPHIYE